MKVGMMTQQCLQAELDQKDKHCWQILANIKAAAKLERLVDLCQQNYNRRIEV